jgi:hypothetical protein
VAPFVDAQVDQRVLLGETAEREVEPRSLGGIPRSDDRLERRRREVAVLARTRAADRVADPDLGEAPELRDLAGADRSALHVAAVVEHADGGHLGLAVAAERQPVAHVDRAAEEPGVGDLLSGRPTLDLEDASRGRSLRLTARAGCNAGDAGHERLDARTRLG